MHLKMIYDDQVSFEDAVISCLTRKLELLSVETEEEFLCLGKLDGPDEVIPGLQRDQRRSLALCR